MKTTSYPPSPKGLPLVGHLISRWRDPIGLLMKAAHDYGDIVHLRFGLRNFFLLSHPKYIEDVLVIHHRDFDKNRPNLRARRVMGEGLVTSNGDFHLRQRRLIQPAFSRQHIANYANVMTECALRTREYWQEGMTLDIAEEMLYLSLAIIGKTLFGADLEADAKGTSEALAAFMEWSTRPVVPFFSKLLEKLPLPSSRRRKKAIDQVDTVIYRIINERRASGMEKDDLLSLLLRARDEEGDGRGMTDKQVRDEAVTLFLAGHETTANALTWTWYLLSQNPDAEAKLHNEIDTVLAGKLPTFDDIPRLPYTRMVFAEAMRLYPPIWIARRRALKDYKIESYVLPAGSFILMCQYVVHRDPRYFSDPLSFMPERWTPEIEAKLPRCAYFPFGAGPRLCIGESFSWTEGILTIAILAQKWRMRLVPDHPIELLAGFTLRPKHGMRMMIEQRKPLSSFRTLSSSK